MLSLLCLTLSIVLLSLSMPKHYKACFQRPLTRRREKLFSCTGWALLLASIALVNPLPINYVIWCCQLSMVILLQAWLLSSVQSK